MLLVTGVRGEQGHHHLHASPLPGVHPRIDAAVAPMPPFSINLQDYKPEYISGGQKNTREMMLHLLELYLLR